MKKVFSSNILVVFTPLILVLGIGSFSSKENAISNHRMNKKGSFEITSNAWVENQMRGMSLREKIGQFFMVAAYSGKDENHFREIDSLVIRDKVGGIIFFQGNRDNLKVAIDRFQSKAKTPLLIGMDAEWGVSMRLKGESRFPYNYTLGAANDAGLSEKIARMMGQECRELGIHINFAPVADVNSNPRNPVIGFRAFGEYPKDVADHVSAMVKGMESQGVMTSVKHFPGHGDTDVDSHLALPTVNNTEAHINAIDFFPFRAGIKAGTSTIMVGHLNVPALDNTGTPSSLSGRIIQEYLQNQLGFKGLVVSDALGMKAVADKYGKSEVVVKAFEAGCDILLFPKIVEEAIDAIERKVKSGEISQDLLDDRCRKVLLHKHKSVISPPNYKKYSNHEIELTKRQVFEKAITLVKNENGILPLKKLDKRIAHVSIGGEANALINSMDLISKVDHFHFKSGTDATVKFKGKMSDYELVITSVHPNSVRPKKGIPKGLNTWLETCSGMDNVLIHFGNPLDLNVMNLNGIESVLIGYEGHALMQERMGQMLLGAAGSQGRLPITINEYKRGTGIQLESAGRLNESQPEAFGVSRKKLAEIDSIVATSIKAGAFPGCQIVVALEGKVIYNKAFGHHTYKSSKDVKLDDMYDIASITKIAASTLSAMRLNGEGVFSLDSTLKSYLPELVNGTSYKNIRLRSMLAHQAGLTPWIPFYTKTLANGKLNYSIYSKNQDSIHEKQVASNLWIGESYTDNIYNQILATPLRQKRYKYSDVGYYFLKKIIEKETKKPLDEYVSETFYAPMGLSNISFNPLNYVEKRRIPPTENDTIFRKQLIHGYVHDQGASMMGGVAGHAGLFSNARDLAAIMQLFLNDGNYGNVEYVKSGIIPQYTKCQYCPSNRRGAGFDKPTTNLHGGPTTNLVSLSSFGHSGFTGTLAWSDPKYKVNYVFLSNRVYPDAENWKIVRMNIRTDIQKVIYEAILAAKK